MVQRSGFTFIEIILVLAIIMVVGAISMTIPNLTLGSASSEAVLYMLRSNLRKAQLYSMNGKNATMWGVALRNDELIVFLGTEYAHRDPAFDERVTLPRGATLSGFDEVVFERESGRLPEILSGISIQSAGTPVVFSVNREGAVERSE
ncbi:MAG: hypothetical protein KA731_01675 [Candidatus Moranbacteria bacterium]|nr:hypothetical protein [Candidatus Moranbacteria bacterium]